MSVQFGTEEILRLAKSRTPADRERLMLAVVDLAGSAEGEAHLRTPPIQSLLSSIFMTLVVEAENDIRRRLAERLCAVDWAPPALINVLATDEIEIAQPVIAQSPVLKDHDLIRLLVEATVEHQIAVARRPRLGPPVVTAILQQAEPAVLSALAGNLETDLSPTDMSQLVLASRRVAGLRAPLSRRPELNEAMARQLYVWVGQALRTALVGRFALDAAALDASLAEAIRDAHGGAPIADGEAFALAGDAEREAMELRLISKLLAAGQLRPSFLLRALREQRLTLFERALSALGGFDVADIRKAMDSTRPELLALACQAAGIDRSVFTTLLELVRELNAGRPSGGAEGTRKALSAFGPFSATVAKAAFRQAIASV